MHHSKLIIYDESLNTAIFKADSRKVANILRPIVLDTDAFEWGGINLTQNKVIKVWLDLVSHYNIYTESKQYISVSRYKLSNLFYKNKTTFNFDRLSAILKTNFDIMDKYGKVRSEREKIHTLL